MHLLLDEGRLKATLQPRINGQQSRVYCCDEGHATIREAAEHGALREVEDELSTWEALPQPEIVTSRPAVRFNENTGTYFETMEEIDPEVAGGHGAAHVFDKRLLADPNYPHATLQEHGTVLLLGRPYRIVHEGPACFVAIQAD